VALETKKTTNSKTKHPPAIFLTKHNLIWLIVLESFVITQNIFQWPLIRILGASPWGFPIFWDTKQVMVSSDCLRSASSYYFSSHEVTLCNYLYGDWLAKGISFLGLSASSSQIVGWVQTLAITAIFALMAGKYSESCSSRLESWLVPSLVLLSPPILLLLERANFDILIFCFVLAGCLGMNTKLWPVSGLLLLLCAEFKFYPLVSLIAIFYFADKKSKRIFLGVVTALAILQVSIELAIKHLHVPDAVGYSFGIHSLGLWWNYFEGFLNFKVSLSPLWITFLGYTALVLCVKIMRSLSGVKPRALLHYDTQDSNLKFNMPLVTYVFGVTLVGCYLAGENLDYRFVFIAPFVLSIGSSRVFENKSRIRFMALAISVLWLSFGTVNIGKYLGVMGQFLGDVLTTFLIAEILLILSRYMGVEKPDSFAGLGSLISEFFRGGSDRGEKVAATHKLRGSV